MNRILINKLNINNKLIYNNKYYSTLLLDYIINNNNNNNNDNHNIYYINTNILNKSISFYSSNTFHKFNTYNTYNNNNKLIEINNNFINNNNNNNNNILYYSTNNNNKNEKKNNISNAASTPTTKALLNKTLVTIAKLPWKISIWTLKTTKDLTLFLFKCIRNPKLIGEKYNEIKLLIKETAHHYWLGSKLLASDVKTATRIVRRVLKGHTLTRRERNQLTRTLSDIFRLVPMAVFVIVPFMEFLLPFALKIFPNMLPSTFRDHLKQEEAMKRELQMRISLAQFMQDTLTEMTHKKNNKLNEEDTSAKGLMEFIENAKLGKSLNVNDIIRFARYFEDELTLDNLPRGQLVNMCRYMGLTPYGADAFLRFQLRMKIRSIKEDDQKIMWEGVETLSKIELQEACAERGMRAMGLRRAGYERQLKQWLALSHQKVPPSLLIMSRAFTLGEEGKEAEQAIATQMSNLDEEVVTEILLKVASKDEISSDELRKLKIKAIEYQNELIDNEYEEKTKIKKSKDEDKDEKEKEIDDIEDKYKDKKDEIIDDDKKDISTILDDAMKDAEVKKDEKITADIVKKTIEENKKIIKDDIDNKNNDELIKDDDIDEPKTDDDKDDEKESKPLTAAQVEALGDLAAPSLVDKERNLIKLMKESLENESDEENNEEIDEIYKKEKEHFNESWKENINQDKIENQIKNDLGMNDKDIKDKEINDNQKIDDNIINDDKENVEQEMKKDEQKEEEVVVEEEEEEEEDYVEAHMKIKLKNMLNKLEYQIEKVDDRIGDKLYLLDKDKDGIISIDEIVPIMENVLKEDYSSDELLKVIEEIDEDRDGKISLTELLDWVEKRKEIEEMEQYQYKKDDVEEKTS